MTNKNIIKSLENNLLTFSSLLRMIEPDQYLYKLENADWCILEIVCHLYDEEREDFRTRLRSVLESPLASPPPIDPPAWVKERNYIDQDYGVMLQKFEEERKHSIVYLKSLDQPKWDNYYEHAHLGKLDGNHFLRNWLAHDYLHIKQIIQRKYQFLHSQTGDISYAGKWT